MRTHRIEPLVDRSSLAAADLVHRRLHVVVDPAARDPECRESAGVCIEEHLVALTGIRRQPERPRSTQLHVRQLQLAVHPADHKPLVAPVELERLAPFEGERHERFSTRLRMARAPRPNEVRQPRIAALVTLTLDLLE